LGRQHCRLGSEKETSGAIIALSDSRNNPLHWLFNVSLILSLLFIFCYSAEVLRY
jgi:hypothetical membrane protein